jgi:hypothetical protein
MGKKRSCNAAVKYGIVNSAVARQQMLFENCTTSEKQKHASVKILSYLL